MRKQLNDIARILIEDRKFVSGYGLLHGKMGIALALYELSANKGDGQYESEAGRLLDKCLEHISELPCDFKDGLHGVGWGLQYLISQNLIEGDADEVLFDIDSYCWKRFFEAERSFDKWVSCALYFRERIRYREAERQGLYMSILRQQMIYVIDDAEYWLNEWEKEFSTLKKEQDREKFSTLLLIGMSVLIGLHQLNIFNFKVEKALKRMLEIIRENKQVVMFPSIMWLSGLLKKMQVLVFENYDVEELLRELSLKLKVEECVCREWLVSNKVDLLLWFCLLEAPVDLFIDNELNDQDIEQLRKERKYGIAGGLAGLIWGLLKTKRNDNRLQ